MKKTDLIQGFEKLRIRLSAKDIDMVWTTLDAQKRGFVNFNDFCVLQEQKVLNDPYALKSLETRVQDNLAYERKLERDRIALELIEKMSQAGSEQFQKELKAKTQQPFGILSLPTDNMNSIMSHQFNKDYIRMKISHDDSLEQVKVNKLVASKIRRDTNSNRLKTEKQVALAMSLKEEQLKKMKMMHGGGLKNSIEGKLTDENQPSEKEDSILPPLTASRGKSSGAANL